MLQTAATSGCRYGFFFSLPTHSPYESGALVFFVVVVVVVVTPAVCDGGVAD